MEERVREFSNFGSDLVKRVLILCYVDHRWNETLVDSLLVCHNHQSPGHTCYWMVRLMVPAKLLKAGSGKHSYGE